MLKGRLGLETARIPHADRAGLLWLSRGALTARDGTLSFERGPHVAENDPLEPGHYAVPFQGVSIILLGPGSTVSHDALRLLARHGTALAAVGEDGVRCYTAPPLIADRARDSRDDRPGPGRTRTFVCTSRGACTPGVWVKYCPIGTSRSSVASKAPG